MSKKVKPDRACIRVFASLLEAIGRPVAGVDRWPEDEADGEIDAIVGPYAIQHTSVDTLPDGRLADARFKQVVGALEEELAGNLGFPLAISWNWAAVQKGQQWPAICAALRGWILKEARNLADGYHHVTNLPGVPFALDAWKAGPIKFDGVRFARYDPKDATFTVRLHDQLAGRHDKLTVLGRHQADGKITVLLLESADVALMNSVMMVEALEAVFPTRPEAVDQVWFMHYVAPATVNVHDLRSGGIWVFDQGAGNVSLHNPHGPQLRWAT
jgi:hypothetical protein